MLMININLSPPPPSSYKRLPQQVIAMQSTGAAEEAFMAAGKLMDKIEGNFNR
jgi:hypothetical protein